VLGRLVEVLRGMPYAQAFRQHLAGPLGIDELAFSADEALQFRTAIGHGRPTPEAAQRPLKAWAVMPPSNPAAGNQLAMSARGLLALARLHLADGLAPDGTRLLSEAGVGAMRERQLDQPAGVGVAAGQGLGWMLSRRTGVVEHGGGTLGVAAMLSLVPGSGVAIAVLTNGGSAAPLIDELLDHVLGDLAAIPPLPALPVPDAAARVSDHQRYVGRYETRPTVQDVTLDEAGRLWLTSYSRNEALAMEDLAGIESLPQRHELRRVRDDTFVVMAPSGAARRAVAFLGRDAAGRARFLHTGRAAVRTA
jgi:CubicO group peptidase (beta-lactamase class C family)